MDRFHVVEDAAVIVRKAGVYKQVKVYVRGTALYAGLNGGFVRLYKDGGTGVPAVSWDDMDVLGYAAPQMTTDAHGKLSLPKGAKMIEGKAS